MTWRAVSVTNEERGHSLNAFTGLDLIIDDVTMLVLLGITCLLGLVTSASFREEATVHRQKRQVGGVGEIGINCENGTLVRTPYIYVNNRSRDSVLSDLPHIQDPVYLDACRHFLGDDHTSDSVYDAYNSPVFKYSNNETVRYRALVCCKDKPTKLRCFSCVNETSTYACDYHHDTVQCEDGQQCLTTYTCPATKNGYTYISKGCTTPNSTCNSTNSQGGCYVRDRGESCGTCCDEPHCNENGTRRYCSQRITRIYPCSPSPCLNGGICRTLGYTSKDNYTCCCMPGYEGRNCSQVYTSSCSNNVCQNGGTCYLLKNDKPFCNCTSGYTGDRCEKKVPPACYESKLRMKPSSYMTIRNCSYVYGLRWSRISYLSTCGYHVRSAYQLSSTFVEGVDGQVGQTQFIGAGHCYGGQTCAKYQLEICCPSCYMKPCQNGGYCVQSNDGTGGYVCKCRFGYSGKNCEFKIKACFVFGEPHYVTFDLKHIPFQGKCKYVMASAQNGGDGNTEPFVVKIQHEKRNGLQDVTFPKYLEIEIFGYTVKLGKYKSVYVSQRSIINQQVYPTVSYPSFTITMNGQFVRFESSFGLVVEYDGYFVGLIQVPSQYANKLSGLCNDMDGQGGDDDLKDCFGIQQSDNPAGHARYGDSCLVDDPENDDKDCKTNDGPTCSDKDIVLYSGSNWCDSINDTTGPFASCIKSAQINIPVYFASCVYDTCRSEELKCATYVAFATACSRVGTPPQSDWRSVVNCPMNCSMNSTYVFRGAACQPTCDQLDAPATCPYPNTEVCVCNDGLILKDGVCVEPSECGCKDGNTRYKIGDTWGYEQHPDGTCSEKECVVCTTCDLGVGEVVRNTVSCTGVTDDDCSDGFDPDEICNTCDGTTVPCNFFGDPCDNATFYMCSPGPFGDQQSNAMHCPSCQVWAQIILTCVNDDRPGCPIYEDLEDIDVNDDNKCSDGNVLLAVPGNVTQFMMAGMIMSCAAGTVFDPQKCTCVHGFNPVDDTGPKVIACIDFNDENLLASIPYIYVIDTLGSDFRAEDEGIYKHAYKFTGQNTLEVEYFRNWENSQLSITFWYKRTGANVNGAMTLFSNAPDDNLEPSISIISESQNTIGGGFLTVGPVDVGQINGASGLSAPFNTWNNVAVVYDSEFVKTYINGQLQVSSPARGHIVRKNHPLHIGRSFVGLIDEICFFRSALSGDDVKEMYDHVMNDLIRK